MPMRILALLFSFLLLACGDDGPVASPEEDSGGDTGADLADLPAEQDRSSEDTAGTTDTREDSLGLISEPDAPPVVLAEQGPWGPAARVVDMDIPQYVNQAQYAGCLVFGDFVGTGLGSLILLVGGLDQFFRPNADGEIAFIMLWQAVGWEADLPSDGLGEIDLRVYDGAEGEDETWGVLPSSFVDNDPEQPVISGFSNTVVGHRGWLESPPSEFVFQVPIFQDFFVGVTIELATFRARIFADGPGFGFENGTITGYVTRSAMVHVAEVVRDACFSEEPPPVCDVISGQIQEDDDPEELIDLFLGFTAGLDVKIEDGVPASCDDDDEDAGCNALGICILVEAEGVTIGGMAP
jgi:predicted small lipoprotein YifL